MIESSSANLGNITFFTYCLEIQPQPLSTTANRDVAAFNSWWISNDLHIIRINYHLGRSWHDINVNDIHFYWRMGVDNLCTPR